MPQFAAAIEAQINCDDTSDDFVEEKLHSDIRSSRADSMARLSSNESAPPGKQKSPGIAAGAKARQYHESWRYNRLFYSLYSI